MEKLAAENPIPMYWVRPEQIVSAEPGMHRFVWNLHHAPPDALEHEFPISAIYRDTPRYPLGAWVLPGPYTAKLSSGFWSFTKTFTVEMDPRIKTPSIALHQQFEMETGAVAGMNTSFAALARVQSVRAQLKDRAAKAASGTPADSIAAMDKKCAELEGAAQSSFFGVAPGAKPPENFSTLNQHFGGILAVADSADAAPTTQAAAVYKELQAALQDLTGRWTKIREQDISALNVELKKSGLAVIDLSKLPDAAPSADADSDDKP